MMSNTMPMSMQPLFEKKKELSTSKKVAIVVFWLAVWEIADRIIDDRLILAGPIRVVQALYIQFVNVDFWIICGASFGRLACGFLLSFVVSAVLALVAWRFSVVRDFIDPIVSVLKTVPMISFVIMLLIWVGNQMLTVYLSLLVVLPFIYTAVLAGFENADTKMLEMSKTYRLSAWKKFLYIYRPAVMPFLLSSCKVALGMSWKTGIMAEVIGTPRPSIGREMNLAKSYLDTPDLFAWTVVVIVLSLVFEKVFMVILEQANRPMEGYLLRAKDRLKHAFSSSDTIGSGTKANGCIAVNNAVSINDGITARSKLSVGGAIPVLVQALQASFKPVTLSVKGLCKSFGETEVLRNITVTFKAGGAYCLMAPSGAGKTTFLRVLAGLEQATKGQVKGASARISVMFQENRLCEQLTPVGNVALVCTKRPSVNEAFQELKHVLPVDCMARRAHQLSGGMRRRLALARALAFPSEAIILDEPFTGLDEETKKKVAAFLVECRCGRTLIVATHNKEDAALLGAEIVLLDRLSESQEQ